MPLWKLLSLPKIQSPLSQQFKHTVFQAPLALLCQHNKQIYVESVYLFYASKSLDIKRMWTLTISTKTSIITTESMKKWILCHFENYTKPSEVNLQKAASPIANLLNFFSFLQKNNEQRFTNKLILAEKHSSGHLTSLVMQEIHLNLTTPHTLWCPLVLPTDLINLHLQNSWLCPTAINLAIKDKTSAKFGWRISDLGFKHCNAQD